MCDEWFYDLFFAYVLRVSPLKVGLSGRYLLFHLIRPQWQTRVKGQRSFPWGTMRGSWWETPGQSDWGVWVSMDDDIPRPAQVEPLPLIFPCVYSSPPTTPRPRSGVSGRIYINKSARTPPAPSFYWETSAVTKPSCDGHLQTTTGKLPENSGCGTQDSAERQLSNMV